MNLLNFTSQIWRTIFNCSNKLFADLTCMYMYMILHLPREYSREQSLSIISIRILLVTLAIIAQPVSGFEILNWVSNWSTDNLDSNPNQADLISLIKQTWCQEIMFVFMYNMYNVHICIFMNNYSWNTLEHF